MMIKTDKQYLAEAKQTLAKLNEDLPASEMTALQAFTIMQQHGKEFVTAINGELKYAKITSVDFSAVRGAIPVASQRAYVQARSNPIRIPQSIASHIIKSVIIGCEWDLDVNDFDNNYGVLSNITLMYFTTDNKMQRLVYESRNVQMRVDPIKKYGDSVFSIVK